MKCYYHYLTKKRNSLQTIVISDNPLIIVDIDQDGNSMGVEYCE